jgi:hypothetical protein
MSVGDGEHYVIIGRPESGYSMKMRSTMRYKAVPHEWLDRCHRAEELYQVQLIPLVFRPDATAVQDSTPILLSILRRKLDVAGDDPQLRPFLDETGCLGHLQAADP